MPKFDLNAGVMWAMITATVAAVVYVFTSFVTVEANDLYHKQQDVISAEFRTSVYYNQFYNLKDRYEVAKKEDNITYAAELARQLERVKAKICEEDPEWERCS